MSLAFLQSKIIFFPEKLPPDFSFHLAANEEEVFIETPDGERINGIWSKVPDRKGVVLYFHGNAGSLDGWKPVARDFNKLHYDVLIIDYRGYGKSTGEITEEGLYTDAEATWRYALAHGVSASEILIYGRSIGTGPAVELAVRAQKSRALILETPFTSLLDMAQSIYPFLLPRLTLRFHFENEKKLANIGMPVLLIHGTRDEIIPISHSQTLHQKFKERTELVIIEGGTHNDLSAFPAYEDALIAFLEKHFTL
jgi:pimeloyl-ACP methyl ester carboxylesterase